MTEPEQRWAQLVTEAVRGLVNVSKGVHLIRPNVRLGEQVGTLGLWLPAPEFAKEIQGALDDMLHDAATSPADGAAPLEQPT